MGVGLVFALGRPSVCMGAGLVFALGRPSVCMGQALCLHGVGLVFAWG